MLVKQAVQISSAILSDPKLRFFQRCSIELDGVRLSSKIERNRTHTEIFQFDCVRLSK